MKTMIGTSLFAALALFAWGCGGSSGHSRGAHEVHSEAGGCGCEHGRACTCRHHGEGGEAHACNCPHGGHRGEHGEHHGGHGGEHGAHGEHGEHHGGHGGEHAPGPVSDFHAVLAPLWHAEHGPARADATCAAVADLTAKAAAIHAGPAPQGGDETAYRAAAEGLKVSVEALGTACAEAGRPSFETRFEAVHTSFHAVAESSGAGHGHH